MCDKSMCDKCRNSGVVLKCNEVWCGVYWCDCLIGQEGKQKEIKALSNECYE
jgi:hypothetical protein